MANKWVYTFKEGNMTMRNLLGGKGANLAEMTEIGLPVPQGFTISTEACTQYYEDGRKINDEIMAQTMEGVKWMEEVNGKKFGDLKNPLLVSVRSGARASMPGMMDTILNLGLNDEVVAAMIEGNPDPKFERFVYDSYRRFIQMFSDVVMEVGKKYFEQLIDKMKAEKGVEYDVDLTAADLKTLAEQFKAEYKKQLGEDFPSDPVEQLKLAIEAVFRSWDNPRANVYRRDNDIPYSWGTAVNVMPMVFGNLNDESGTGVYWGTSGERITDTYMFDSFGMTELIESSVLLCGKDIRNQLKAPEFSELYADVKHHYETIRKYVQKSGRSFYSFGWMLDIARCIYTLRTGKIIAKTDAADWALENNLCPDPDALRIALEVRRNPLNHKEDKQTFDYAETLAEPIQRFADVLEKELTAAKEA